MYNQETFQTELLRVIIALFRKIASLLYLAGLSDIETTPMYRLFPGGMWLGDCVTQSLLSIEAHACNKAGDVD